MRKISDRVILGIIAGSIGWLPKEVLNLAAYYLGLQSSRYAKMVAGLFLNKRQASATRAGIWFGVGGDLVVGALLGVPLAFVMSWTGRRHAALKGAILSLVGFGTFRGYIANMGPEGIYPRDIRSNVAMTLSSIVWGLTAGSVMNFIADDSVFAAASQGNPQRQQGPTRSLYRPVGVYSEKQETPVDGPTRD